MNYSLQEHFKQYDEDTTKYMDEVLRIFSDKILNKTAGLTVKSQILTVLLQRKDGDNFKKLIPYIDIPELVRGCEILDAERFKRQTQQKLQKYPDSTKLIQRVHLLDSIVEDIHSMSLCLSKIKIVKQWVKSLSKEKLEHKAMLFSTELWKKLADLTHLNPKTDFPESCEWFLPYCFGKELPDGNIVRDFKNLTYENFNEMYAKHNFSYEAIRTKLNLGNKMNEQPSNYRSFRSSKKSTHRTSKYGKTTRQPTKYRSYHRPTNSFVNPVTERDKERVKNIKTFIVNRENLNTVIWYWDELVEEYNINDVLNRIRANNEGRSDNLIKLSYGKIVDIISKTSNEEVMKELIKLGEERLTNYEIKLKQPVAVFGDQSGSMEIAIKTSGIVTSLLCYICNAHLHLFHSTDECIADPPRTITNAVKFGKEVRTQGSTAPASSLAYYYYKKIRLATIILITDEEENTSFDGYRFADLYLKYLNEVCQGVPETRLVFISFSDPNTDGQMVASLKALLIGKTIGNEQMTEERFNDLVKVFKFNVSDPDLNRMDVVLKYLSITG